MYYPLTEFTTMEMGDLLNVDYTAISLTKRFSRKPRYFGCYDTRWIHPRRPVRRVYFTNYGQSLNVRFSSHHSLNQMYRNYNDVYRAESEFFQRLSERRTVLPQRLMLRNEIGRDFRPYSVDTNVRIFRRASCRYPKTTWYRGHRIGTYRWASRNYTGNFSYPRHRIYRGNRGQKLKQQLDDELDEYMSHSYRGHQITRENRLQVLKQQLDDELDEYMASSYTQSWLSRQNRLQMLKQQLDDELDEYMYTPYADQTDSKLDGCITTSYMDYRFSHESCLQMLKQQLDDELDEYMAQCTSVSNMQCYS